jgi:S1-C subfamily serine protease
MYADAVAKITESIFPIFFVRQDGDVSTIGVSGTGFFVDDNGLFVTADHIMTCAPAGSTMYYYGRLPGHLCQVAVEVECVASDPARDLYLGRVTRDYHQPVEFSNEAVRPGNSVCLSGYPLIVPWVPGGLARNVRHYWQPTFVIDATQAVVDNRTYDGYIVQDACFPGMSGGPAFDTEGKVRGMAVARHTRTIQQPGSGNPLVVANGIVIDVEHIRQFIEASCRSCSLTPSRADHRPSDG